MLYCYFVLANLFLLAYFYDIIVLL